MSDAPGHESSGAQPVKPIDWNLGAYPRTVPLGSLASDAAGSRRSVLALGGDPQDGLVSLERYRVVREIGHGGMGVVYQAHDTVLGREVALKVLLVSGRVDDEAIGRFEREARAAASLEHPHIVRVYDVGRLPASAGGLPYYTMELLHGDDLAHAIACGRLTPRDATELVRQVALALAHAHRMGVLHRDIKPQNILIAADGGAKLADFGLAKLTEHHLSSDPVQSGWDSSVRTLTQTGQLLGTPQYMSPEQALGDKRIDVRTDVYSLGATLYEAMTGKPPFEAPTLASLLAAIHRDDPVPPRRVDPGIDVDVETICLACLAKEPRHRYQTAEALAEDCKRFLAGEPISRRPVGTVGRLWRKAKRNRAVAIPVSLLVVAALSALLAFGERAIRGLRIASHADAARAHLAEGRFAEARARAEEAIGLAPDVKAHQDLRAQAQAGLLAEEATRALGARDFARAETRARQAAELAPMDRRYADLLAQALAGQASGRGAESLARYREHRDRIAGLARDLKEAAEREKSAPLDRRPQAKDARWVLESDLRSAEMGRAGAWSDAAVEFTQAVTLWKTQADARAGLTELYWDRYLDAERDRDRAAEAAYGPLVVEFGGEEYAERVRCEREVRVVFLLPEGFRGDRVDLYLFEYKVKEAPPVLVPIPLPVGELAPSGGPKGPGRGEDVPDLARDPAFGRPIPLSELRTRPVEGTWSVTRARARSVFALRTEEANHVSLPVAREPGGCPSVEFRGSLGRGSYLLYVPPGQGLYETRYPFEVDRQYEWTECCELVVEEAPPRPPGVTEEEGPLWVYIPAGPYRAGGDRDADQSPRRDGAVLRVSQGAGIPIAEAREADRVATIGYFLGRFEVTSATWLEYLTDRSWHTAEEAFKRCPRVENRASASANYWPQDATGRFRPAWDADWPVLGVAWNDAEDFCRWLTKVKGEGVWEFMLPTEDEWERAARGVDGRYFPWGDGFDDSFCGMQDSRLDEQPQLSAEPFGLFPLDESPFGVRDMAGGVREATASAGGPMRFWRVFKGGMWSGPPSCCRGASRVIIDPENTHTDHGVRVEARRVRP